MSHGGGESGGSWSKGTLVVLLLPYSQKPFKTSVEISKFNHKSYETVIKEHYCNILGASIKGMMEGSCQRTLKNKNYLKQWGDIFFHFEMMMACVIKKSNIENEDKRQNGKE